MDYDRRTAGVDKSVEALKPLVAEAEEASAAFKRGLAEIEKARGLINKVWDASRKAIPRYHQPRSMFGPQDGDAAYAVYDYARHLKDELDDDKLPGLKKIAPWFDEFVGEIKDNIRLTKEAPTK